MDKLVIFSISVLLSRTQAYANHLQKTFDAMQDEHGYLWYDKNVEQLERLYKKAKAHFISLEYDDHIPIFLREGLEKVVKDRNIKINSEFREFNRHKTSHSDAVRDILREIRPEKFAIVDTELEFLIEDLQPYAVQVERKIGLTKENVDKTIEILNE